MTRKIVVCILFLLFGVFFTVVFLTDILKKEYAKENIHAERLFEDTVMIDLLREATDTPFETKMLLLVLFGLLPLILSALSLFIVISKKKKIVQNDEPSKGMESENIPG